jgi:hypothetical protein
MRQGDREGRPYNTRVNRLARPVYCRGGACPRPGFSGDSPQNHIRQQSLREGDCPGMKGRAALMQQFERSQNYMRAASV